jgi:hypothetical protein
MAGQDGRQFIERLTEDYEVAIIPRNLSGLPADIWDDANVDVDDKGWLHLKLTSVTNATGSTERHCTELSTQQRLGFGGCQFQVIGRIDRLDRNVVLGLFKYPTPDVGKCSLYG